MDGPASSGDEMRCLRDMVTDKTNFCGVNESQKHLEHSTKVIPVGSEFDSEQPDGQMERWYRTSEGSSDIHIHVCASQTDMPHATT